MYSLTRCALHGNFVRRVILVVFFRLVELMFGTMFNTLEKMFLPKDLPEQANVLLCLLDGRLARFVSVRRLNRRLIFASLLRTSNSRAEMHYTAKDGLLIYEHYNLWPVMGSTIKNDLLCRRLSHCLLYTSPSPRDQRGSRMPSSA